MGDFRPTEVPYEIHIPARPTHPVRYPRFPPAGRPPASCVQGDDTDTTSSVTPVNSVITVELKYDGVASVTISPVIG